MNPAARLSMALLSGLLLWWPTLTATLRGDMGLPEASMRYLAAFLFARLGIASIAWLVESYAGERQDGDGELAGADGLVVAEGDDPGRRATDGLASAAGAS